MMIMQFQTMSQENIINMESQQKDEKKKLGNIPLLKCCVDILFFVAAALPVHGFYVYDATSYRRGFFCNDKSIRHPYKEDTISNSVLYIVGYSVPSLVIILNEVCEMLRSRWKRYHAPPLKNSILVLVWKLYCRVGVFLFGAYINEIITNVTKIVIGRLRPCFIDICRPNIDCSIGNNPYSYILNFTCTSNQISRIEDGRKSFPSGHSSFSFYVMLFLVSYLQFCMTFKVNKLLKPSLQLIFLLIAWFTSMSRISDYKHHWSDVLVGMSLGSMVALATVHFISDFYPRSKKNKNTLSKTVDPQQDIFARRSTTFN